jgi:hypothetical protein
MNELDYLLLLIIFIGAVRGVFRGWARPLISLGCLYVSMVLAIGLHQRIGGFIGMVINMGESINVTVGFLLTLLATYFLLRLALWQLTLKTRQDKAKKPISLKDMAIKQAGENRGVFSAPLDVIGGFLLGGVLFFIWASLITSVIGYAFSSAWPAYNEWRVMFAVQLSSSSIKPLMHDMTRLIYRSISIWFPDQLPSIFRSLYG